MDVELAEHQLNSFLDRAAAKSGEARAGQQRANEIEAFWRASERAHERKRREENRLDWIRHYRGLALAHHDAAARASEAADRLEAAS